MSANESNVGDALVCTATATDSSGLQDTATGSVTIQNTAPTVSSGNCIFFQAKGG